MPQQMHIVHLSLTPPVPAGAAFFPHVSDLSRKLLPGFTVTDSPGFSPDSVS